MSIGLVRRAGVALFAACVLVSIAPRGASAQGVPIQVTVGDTTTLQLDGNPSTGYSWVLDDGASQSKELVSVKVLGYAKAEPVAGERPLLGAGKKFQVLVTGVQAGQVALVFKYVKGGESAPAKTQDFAIEVLGEASAAPPDDENRVDPPADELQDPTRDLLDAPSDDPSGSEAGSDPE